MHRLLERLDAAASTVVPLAYLCGMLLGTAAYFSGLVVDAGVAVGLALAIAIELHGFLEQRRVRALWSAHHRALDEDTRERLGGELRAHVAILAGLVLFQAYNSLQFLSATWRPAAGFVPMPVQLVLRSLILPAAFLVSGALSPLMVEASDELRHASRRMLHRTLRATLRQWDARINRASRAGTDLAPVAVSLMLDAGDADGARRINLIAEGLATAEQAPRLLEPAGSTYQPSVRTSDLEAAQSESGRPPRPPTGPGSPTAHPRGIDAASVTTARSVRPAILRLTPDTPRKGARSNGRGVRTASAEAKARAAWDHGARTVGELERAAGVTRSTAGKYRRTFLAEESTAAQAAR